MNLLAQHGWWILPLVTLLTVGLCLLLIPLSHKFHWVDYPSERKLHQERTPLVGGIAIFLILACAFLVPPFELLNNSDFKILMLGAALILVVGAIDDRWGLSPAIKFLMQILACLFVIRYTGWNLEDFGTLFSNRVVELGVIAIPVTIFSALGVINAFNLADGMDGLAGGLFLVASVGIIAFALSSGHREIAWLMLITSASVIGFLLLNARFMWNEKARLFLGDAGSLMSGFLLAWCLIRLGSNSDRAFMPMTAVWLFAVPLLDTATLIWRRWREGRSAIHADLNHLHHLFLRAGYSIEATWGLILLLAVCLAGIGVGFELLRLPEWLSFYVFMAIAFSYHFYLKHCWASQKFLGRHFIHHDFEIDEAAARLGRT